MTSKSSQDNLQRAVEEGIRSYLDKRREMIRPFVKRHFSVVGAFRLNRRAFGADLLRAPANVGWAIPYLGLRGLAFGLDKLRLRSLARLLRKLPPGFKTAVEKELEWRIYTEFLELPYEQGKRSSAQDGLFETLLTHPQVQSLMAPELKRLKRHSREPLFRENLEKHLRQYTSSRTAAADVAGSLLTMAAGSAAFHKLTPGAISMGQAASVVVAQQIAIANFAFGSTLGSLWYGIFPAKASLALTATVTASFMAALGLLTAFSGLVTDPAQRLLGLHQSKLRKLIDVLEEELLGSSAKSLKIRDAYAARIFDLVDLIKTAVRNVT